MADGAMSPVRSDGPAKPVVHAAVAREFGGRPHGRAALGGEDPAFREGAVPLHHVAEAEIERAIGGGIERRGDPVLVLELALDQLIAGRPVGHDIGFADDPRRSHAERPEYALREQVPVEHSRGPMDDRAQQQKARVAVAPMRAGREIERGAGGEADEAVLGIVVTLVDGRAVGFQVFGDPGGVRQQVPHRHAAPPRFSLGQVLRDRIVEPELPVFHEQQDARRRELLADRPGLKDAAVGHRDVQLHVGEPVPPRLDHPAVRDDRQRESGNPLAAHLGDDEAVD